MKSTKQKTILLSSMFLIVTGQLLLAHTKGILVDKESRQPIPYVSIYTTNGNKTFGTMSDEKGEFSIDFPFQTLFFVHMNYEKSEIKKSDLSDTIHLMPTTVMLDEVVVSNSEPAWIKRVLNRIAEQKSQHYQTIEKTLAYKYETYTLTDSNGYAFKSNGNLLVPKLSNSSKYYLDAQNNTIKYKDKTAGVDFSNLKRMLYNDFINSFDKKFIKENNFSQNSSFESENTNVVQLVFTSKKFKDDEGYVLIDTLNNIIIEAERNLGTDSNIKTQTSSILRDVVSNQGFYYNTWITSSHIKYDKIGQSYYISECKYKFYMKTTTKNKKGDSQYFSSIESKLYLDSEIKNTSKEYKVIPKPYYIIAIYTKKMQREEDALNKVPVSFEKFK